MTASEPPRLFQRIAQGAMAACLGVMAIAVFVNVVLRYGFGNGIAASEELSRLLFVWMVFIGATAAYPAGEHMAFTSLVGMLQKRPAAFQAFTVLIRLLVVLGHTRCGAVAAAVDSYLNPVGYLGRFFRQPRLIAGWMFAVMRSCGWWVYVVYLPIFCIEAGLGDKVGGIDAGTFVTLNDSLRRLERYWADQIRFRLKPDRQTDQAVTDSGRRPRLRPVPRPPWVRVGPDRRARRSAQRRAERAGRDARAPRVQPHQGRRLRRG